MFHRSLVDYVEESPVALTSGDKVVTDDYSTVMAPDMTAEPCTLQK